MRTFFIKTLTIVGFLLTPLLADFYPQSTISSVSGVSGQNITLSRPLPAKGMSGIIIHRYNDELKAVNSYFKYQGGNTASLIAFEPTDHKSLPAVSTQISTGDKVIGGHLYQNILVLAPDAHTYNTITTGTNKNWIHPDLFALFLAQEGDAYPTRENLAKFASAYQVGLVYIVKRGNGFLYDPVSGAFVSQKPLASLPSVGQAPFYTRVGNIDSGWFSSKAKGDYYQIVGGL